jgi:hypothetical protein
MDAAEEFGYHDLERASLGFILEDETWPVFLEWMRRNHITPAAHAWLEDGPDLGKLRRQYVTHSPDEKIRALADQDWIQP